MQQQKIKTNFGSCFSILIFALILSACFLSFPEEILMQSPKILTHEQGDFNETSLNLSSPIYLTFSDNSFLRNSQIQVFFGEELLDIDDIMIEDCSKSLDIDQFFNPNEKVCLQIRQNNNDGSTGPQSLNIIINSNKEEVKVKVIFLNSKPHLDSLRQHKESYFHSYLMSLEPFKAKILNFYFKKTDIYVDKSFFDSTTNHYSTFSLEYSQEYTQYDKSSVDMSMGMAFAALNKKNIVFKKFAVTWFSIISLLGGFFYSVISIFKLISTPFLKTVYLFHILADLIEFKISRKQKEPKSESKRKNDSKDKKIKKFSMQNWSTHFEIIDNLKKIDIVKKEGIKTNFFDIQVAKSELINPEEDLKISKILNPQVEKKIIIFKYNCNLITIFTFCVRKLFKNKGLEVKIINSGIERVKELLSVKSALNAFNELENLKKFILHKNQIILWDKFHAVFVKTPEKSIDIIDGKKFSYKKFNLSNINSKQLKAYKVLGNSFSMSKNDEKILNMMDWETKKLMDKLIKD